MSQEDPAQANSESGSRSAPLPDRAKAYVGVLAALAVSLIAALAYQAGGVATDPAFPVGAAVFAGLLLLAGSFPVRVGGHTEISAEGIVATLAVAALGPAWAAAAALPVALLVGGRDPMRAAYEASRRTVEVCAAGAVFSATSAPLLAAGAGGPASTATGTAAAVYATLAAGATLLAVNQTLDAGLLKAKYGQGFGQSWRENAAPYLLPDSLAVLTAGMSVLALLAYGPVAAVVLVAGSVGAQALHRAAREGAERSRELAEEVGFLREALGVAGASFGWRVVRELGRKDGLAHRHAAATAVYAADLAREMKLGEERALRLHAAGLVHDVGLVGLPEGLLLQKGRPNSVAQEGLAAHPVKGEEILAAVPGSEDLAQWVRWHHERPDGRGYPDRLRGPWIPVEAKILAAAQAYAALVLDGPARPGIPPREARERLVGGMDAEFDGVVVRAF